jgi:hypothetical protein
VGVTLRDHLQGDKRRNDVDLEICQRYCSKVDRWLSASQLYAAAGSYSTRDASQDNVEERLLEFKASREASARHKRLLADHVSGSIANTEKAALERIGAIQHLILTDNCT